MTRRTTWAWAGVAIAFLGVVVWFVTASIALDPDDEEVPSSGAVSLGGTAAVEPFAGLTETALGVGGNCRRVVVADDDAERIEGLRGRSGLDPYDGMLFVFDAPTNVAFTMSGVPVALDIGFYGSDGRPVSRLRMEPCAKAETECPVYRSEDDFRYALETGVGALSDGPIDGCPS